MSEGLSLGKIVTGAASCGAVIVAGAWVLLSFVLGATNDRVSSLDESVKYLTQVTTESKAGLAEQSEAVKALAASVERLNTSVGGLESTLASMSGTVEALNASFTIADRRDQDFQRLMMEGLLKGEWSPREDHRSN